MSGVPPTAVFASARSAGLGEGPDRRERPLLADRYEILALVGAGGMGTVYRAHDHELDDVVALKVIRPELVATPGILDRFRREAKLARRVTHPNVARVFDIGEHKGEKFLSMEFVEGESLAAALARPVRFPLARAVAVGSAIAEGLGGAHAAGVIHRDLKPDNVLLGRDGRVVITDFGIARAFAEAGHDGGRPPMPPGGASSSLGVVLGTPAYMAPEQVEGRADVDVRADIYAFGTLLYELFTGHRAWPGESSYAVASARLLAPPPDPRLRRPDLPAACAELVLHCMARQPADRPASMGEALAALALAGQSSSPAPAGPAGGSRPVFHDGASLSDARPNPRAPAEPTPRPVSATISSSRPPVSAHAEKTVAVLPFHNAGASDDDYLAEELTDDLLDALSMTHGLKVRARGAVLRYRGADTDSRDIGRELGVQVVVEGSVRRASGRVRVTARLVSVADGFQVWAKRFDRPEQEVLSINDEAARAIAAALTLDGHAEPRDAPKDPVAIDLYLRARHEYRKFWPEHVQRSIGLFEQALAVHARGLRPAEPGSAPAPPVAPDDPLILSGLALALARGAFFLGDLGFARAREVAERAVLAAPQLGEAHLALGSVLFQLGEMPGAVRALRAAVRKSPGLAEARGMLGRILVEAGAVEDGIRQLEAALALDPDAPAVLPDLGRTYALLGMWTEAETVFDRLRREGGLTYWTLRVRLALWRRQHELAEAFLAELPDDDRTFRIPGLLAEAVRTQRLPARALENGEAERVGGWRRRAFHLQMLTEIAGYVGDVDPAFASLQSAVVIGLIDRSWLERCPLLDAVRADPRFASIHAEVRHRTEAILEAYRSA